MALSLISFLSLGFSISLSSMAFLILFFISAVAFLVNVIIKIFDKEMFSSLQFSPINFLTILSTKTVVLPDPAAADTNMLWSIPSLIIDICSSLNLVFTLCFLWNYHLVLLTYSHIWAFITWFVIDRKWFYISWLNSFCRIVNCYM